MRLTKTFLAATAAALFATPVFAQTSKAQVKPDQKVEKKDEKKADAKKEDHAEHKAFDTAEGAPKKWLSDIKLTDAEKTQIKTIEEKYKKQLATLKSDHLAAEKAGKEDDSKIKSKVKTLVDAERAEIKGTLTAEQQAKFDTKGKK